MSFLTALLYDRVMAKTEAACLGDWRRDLLRQASGEVLEIGAGTGASIDYYSAAVTRLLLTEPDPHMRSQLQDKVSRRGMKNVVVAGGSAERIEAGDGEFDYVVTSLVCCSVNDLHTCLGEIGRVLKPGGCFVFLEHVAAADGTTRRKWQNRINPVWKTLMGNCHLNRETERAILDAGFEITQIERESMRKALPIVRPTIRGVARKRDANLPSAT